MSHIDTQLAEHFEDIEKADQFVAEVQRQADQLMKSPESAIGHSKAIASMIIRRRQEFEELRRVRKERIRKSFEKDDRDL